MNPKRRMLISLPLLLAAGRMAHAQQAGATDPALDIDANPMWLQFRDSLFAGRPITTPADDVLKLEAPARAEDAAIVPIALRAQFPQSDTRYIRRIYLIIDNNPSPMGAVFDFTPASGRAEIETRVRVDAYTHMRAIAEMNDGKLFMSTRFVKASGGCSAPPGKDPQAALTTLGRMRLRVEGEPVLNRPSLAQLMMSHPNHSGLAMDQLTRNYTPAHYVRLVRISYAGEPVLTAEVDFTISENPNFRFYFIPKGRGELKAEVLDSQSRRFEATLPVQPVSNPV
ncbi:quinoprotein dehydrogenase-associated SoxYZ-like carrier [Thauera sp. 2A1]|uniref:quinoprotein dehydrogenase-associated SoxYZ-like carrier n=1 Tax=Thauera sp. 2A1 TaxID=2570191 RepID=UPI0012910DB1|nr:quinoprotein dehydrogenase-associated SoxYZ-like carrier [Thauera sp. 2A1]KAI5916845.1 quinoprotein dehydrogenase-associated SoxYZ-like carrier [Thauera sp. 2A1]